MLASAHSRVKRVQGKEVHFYDRNFDMGLQWYLEQMPMVAEDDILLEKTPSYLITPIAAEAIQKVN